MEEIEYCKYLAAEVIKNKSPRMMAILEWCDNINIAIKACGENDRDRKIHSPIIASIIAMEANYVESSLQVSGKCSGHTPLNKQDLAIPEFIITVNREKKSIEITVKIMDFFGMQEYTAYNFAPLVLPLRTEEVEEEIKSAPSIIIPKRHEY